MPIKYRTRINECWFKKLQMNWPYYIFCILHQNNHTNNTKNLNQCSSHSGKSDFLEKGITDWINVVSYYNKKHSPLNRYSLRSLAHCARFSREWEKTSRLMERKCFLQRSCFVIAPGFNPGIRMREGKRFDYQYFSECLHCTKPISWTLIWNILL
jgi:hypothetical protein